MKSIVAGVAALLFAIPPAAAGDYVVQHVALACQDMTEYSAMLHRAGTVPALNSRAVELAVRDPLCVALKPGETVSIVMGMPGSEAVLLTLSPRDYDTRLPTYARGGTYWANF